LEDQINLKFGSEKKEARNAAYFTTETPRKAKLFTTEKKIVLVGRLRTFIRTSIPYFSYYPF
jgi:hypothetical protein